MRVLKFPVQPRPGRQKLGPRTEHRLKPVHFALQYGTPTVWCEEHGEEVGEHQQFVEVVYTGQSVPRELPVVYVGTLQMNEGDRVLHLYSHVVWEH